MAYPTVRQVGILLVVAGTVIFAFSVRPKGQCQSFPPAEVAKRGAGVLSGKGHVSTINNRYVKDAGGRPKFLLGYYHWSAIDNQALIDHPTSFLTMLDTNADYKINYMRVKFSNRLTATTNPPSWGGTTVRTPWVYTGSPAKTDLSTWDSTFWSSFKALAATARNDNVLLHVGLFDSVTINAGSESYRWNNSYWNVNNQTTSFYGDLDLDSDGRADEDGEFYNTTAFINGTGVGAYQKALIDKSVSELSDYENVFFEVGNESYNASKAWHDAVVAYIRTKTDKLVTTNYYLPGHIGDATDPGMSNIHSADTSCGGEDQRRLDRRRWSTRDD
jgi:hypothetical protein